MLDHLPEACKRLGMTKNSLVLLATAASLAAITGNSAEPSAPKFKKIQVTSQFWAEGAHSADFDHDGKKDIVYGPFWWKGPDFKIRQEYSPATNSFQLKKADGSTETIPGFEGALGVNNAYSRNFLTYTGDFNKDSWDDILVYGFPGEETFWYENPKGREGHWQRHVAIDVTDNESPMFVDVNGDKVPDILCDSKGHIIFATINPAEPTKPWKVHNISPKGEWQRFSHGVGIGDINGDGKMDILDKDGWWEQPGSLDGDPVWKVHPFAFTTEGACQMWGYDVDGDGDQDVLTTLAPHGYGLVWWENSKENGQITFKKHLIMGKEANETRHGVKFSQPHAIELADMNRDGLMDMVTGKRFWAHGPQGDVEPNAPAVLYWFQLVRSADKSVDFVPHLIDSDSGVGTQVTPIDVNGDGRLDVVVGNKKGCFVFLQE